MLLLYFFASQNTCPMVASFSNITYNGLLLFFHLIVVVSMTVSFQIHIFLTYGLEIHVLVHFPVVHLIRRALGDSIYNNLVISLEVLMVLPDFCPDISVIVVQNLLSVLI